MINGKQKWTVSEPQIFFTPVRMHTHMMKEWLHCIWYDRHVKLQWVDVIKLWFRIWTNGYGKEVGMSVKASLTAEDVLGKKKKKKNKEREKSKL